MSLVTARRNAQLHSLARLICLSLRSNNIFKRTLSIYLFHFLLQIAQKVNTTTGMALIAQVRMQIWFCRFNGICSIILNWLIFVVPSCLQLFIFIINY